MTFEHWSDFVKFNESVVRRRRYDLEEPSRAFLAAVLASSLPRTIHVERDTELWRAQVASKPYEIVAKEDGEITCVEESEPCDLERMKPGKGPKEHGEGRANPHGIPCLYLASDATTAIAELRPTLSGAMSLARFILHRECQFIDCSRDQWFPLPPAPERDSLPSDQLDKINWGFIAEAFEAPRGLSEPEWMYIPTQILAEHFQSAGFDGIRYRSSQNLGGLSYALFDCALADPVPPVTLQKITRIQYSFEPTAEVP